jgi:tRNA(adenine34) deaminase
MYESLFMEQAIAEAKNAFYKNEVPVGAIVVKGNSICGKGHNNVISKTSVTAHAEIEAINDASHFLQNYRLIDCDIYVTLEPCHMCLKAILDARIKNLYFGALEPKTGAVVSIDNFLDRTHHNHKLNFSGGFMEDNSSDLLKKFFHSRRS